MNAYMQEHSSRTVTATACKAIFYVEEENQYDHVRYCFPLCLQATCHTTLFPTQIRNTHVHTMMELLFCNYTVKRMQR